MSQKYNYNTNAYKEKRYGVLKLIARGYENNFDVFLILSLQ